MSARFLQKSEESKWDKFVMSHPLGTLHQSTAWAHFQAQIPSRGEYFILVIENENKIIGGSLIIRHKMPLGYSWFYFSRGPLLDYESPDLNAQIQLLTSEITKIAKQEKAIFLRIDPPLPANFPLTLKNFHSIPYGFYPTNTLILDLALSDGELLKQMKPKGRYNIRLAEKKGVTIKISDDIDSFYKILKETTSRDGFHPHDKSFYEKMLASLPNIAKLYTAEYESKIIAANIITFFRDTATYYYGASSNEYRNLMAPYILQWRAVTDAKAQGFKYYDFLGIAPENAKNHPWAGVTDFKKKFGGHEIAYLPAMEMPLKKLLHPIYKLRKK